MRDWRSRSVEEGKNAHTTFLPKCGNYRANGDAGFPVEVKNHISWSCHVTLVRGNKQLSNWPLAAGCKAPISTNLLEISCRFHIDDACDIIYQLAPAVGSSNPSFCSQTFSSSYCHQSPPNYHRK